MEINDKDIDHKEEFDENELELGNLLFGNSRGEFRVKRDFNEIFINLLDLCGCDYHACVCTDDCKFPQYIRPDGSFKTDIFCIRPYYWGEDDEIAKLPNFEYYPENIKIDWYKYPLRDSFSNVELSKEKFEEIIQKCMNSLNS